MKKSSFSGNFKKSATKFAKIIQSFLDMSIINCYDKSELFICKHVCCYDLVVWLYVMVVWAHE